jgi:hypothetical protein
LTIARLPVCGGASDLGDPRGAGAPDPLRHWIADPGAQFAKLELYENPVIDTLTITPS